MNETMERTLRAGLESARDTIERDRIFCPMLHIKTTTDPLIVLFPEGTTGLEAFVSAWSAVGVAAGFGRIEFAVYTAEAIALLAEAEEVPEIEAYLQDHTMDDLKAAGDPRIQDTFLASLVEPDGTVSVVSLSYRKEGDQVVWGESQVSRDNIEEPSSGHVFFLLRSLMAADLEVHGQDA